jgi:2-keto-4-pentenoate hydratase
VDDAGHRDLAERLNAAYRDGPIDPPSRSGEPFSLDDAYAVQTIQVTQWLAAGRRQVGHKVGLTSAAMQRQLGVDQPDYGVLFADTVTPDGGATDISGYLQPRIEPEIAFVLGHDLIGPGVTVADAVRAVDHVLPALEIIDSRIRDWKIRITDTVADNASSAGLVLGGRPTRLDSYDLRIIGCVLTVDGAVTATGAGGAVLGSPINALVWLAETLAAHGAGLHGGDIVLPGSVTASQPVTAGQSWMATFASLGSVSVRFTESVGGPA